MSAAGEPVQLERVYVWEWPVRLAHWLIVGSIAVLAVTGLYIGNPFLPMTGEATRLFMMGWVKSLHFWAAMVFSISVLARILWMFVGNPYARWHQFLPLTARRLKGVWNTFAFYVFLHRDSPAFVGHNPLAGLIYATVFSLYIVMICSGLALASANAHLDSMLKSFEFLVPVFGGLQMARLFHHIGMWLLLGFAAHHIWSAFLVNAIEKSSLMDSIFSGYKVLTPDVAKRARKHIEEDE